MSAHTPASVPRVSVVVPTYNRARSLARLLDALRGGEQPQGGMEVVIVDDGSADDTADVVRAHGARYLRQHNAGPAVARECGWRAARGEHIVFLDDDCVPAPNAVAALSRALDDVDGAGARIVPLHQHGAIRGFMQAEGLVAHRVAPDGTILWFVTAGLACRRSALERVHGFDVSFARAGEDVDLTQRMLKTGCSLREVADAVIYHDHQSTLAELFSTYYRRGRVMPMLTRKHRAIREETGRSATGFFKAGDWRTQYRGYRRQASRVRSLVYSSLRAATAAAYVLGALSARIPPASPAGDVGDPEDGQDQHQPYEAF